jgi:hypothetical protein
MPRVVIVMIDSDQGRWAIGQGSSQGHSSTTTYDDEPSVTTGAERGASDNPQLYATTARTPR